MPSTTKAWTAGRPALPQALQPRVHAVCGGSTLHPTNSGSAVDPRLLRDCCWQSCSSTPCRPFHGTILQAVYLIVAFLRPTSPTSLLG
jgi:hypothetical protein